MKNIKKILLLGSGALKIGEAGEFDYSGTQAIKALKEEGKTVVLVNPNIATIQTSKGLADEIYFLPVTAYFVAKVIEKEKPDGIFLSFGGQTALNCGIDLYRQGMLEKHHVEILGTPIQAIIDTEDRKKFVERLTAIGLQTANGKTVDTLKDGLEFAQSLGYPVMLRTGFALGGTGSGIARTPAALQKLLVNALTTAPQVIIEECLYGWKEVEYEVVRDAADNCITVCNMENLDPVGIHTGESIVIAPSQTLTNAEYYSLRDIAIRTIRELGIVGECNIQYALDPATGDYRIIEVNARLSRSSALASKATGYPLAYIAAKLALGKTLPDLPNAVTKKTSAFFEPALDYVVVKMPRWDLAKYRNVDTTIGSEMKSVGEVMSIGRTFKEAIQKAVRMLGLGHDGVMDTDTLKDSVSTLRKRLKQPDSQRIFVVAAALAKGVTVAEIYRLTGIDQWYIYSLARIVLTYEALKRAVSLSTDLLADAKRQGFSDAQIGLLSRKLELDIRSIRKLHHIVPVVKRIDTMAGEFPAATNYFYMTYAASISDHTPTREKKVAVLGAGPYAIGTSVEFDWCAVNTVAALRANHVKSIMINCNPETVSTDYDHSDYLYFEELSLERVLDIWDLEHAPFIVSVGGQIPNNLAPRLHAQGVPLLGSDADTILRAEDRYRFGRLLDTLFIAQPAWSEVRNNVMKQAIEQAKKIGFPVLLRPSFVLSGKAMLVIESEKQLSLYLHALGENAKKYSVVMTKFLQGATECDLDGVAQNGTVLVSALSEHVEKGGVHSGDATLVFPTFTISETVQKHIAQQVAAIVKALAVHGPFNIQFLIAGGIPYVIECNLRASRSFPFVSKALGRNFISIATDVALGKHCRPLPTRTLTYYTVKVPQFSFRRLRGADPVLRVEMSSTGEVAAMGTDPAEAYLKALLSTGMHYPDQKTVFLSLGGLTGKRIFLQGAGRLQTMGYVLYATHGTHEFLSHEGIPCLLVEKLHEAKHPNYQDLVQQKKIGFAVVLPERFTETTKTEMTKGASDGYLMRRMSIDWGIPIFTNAESALFFVESLQKYRTSDLEIKPWGEYSKKI